MPKREAADSWKRPAHRLLFRTKCRGTNLLAGGVGSPDRCLAAVIVVIFWRLETWPARNAAAGTAELERLGRDLRSAFVEIAHLQPQIKINNRIYLEQTVPTSELVILSRRVEVEHQMEHTWAGSSKEIKLHGTFAVKAGFDLRQDLSVNIRPEEIVDSASSRSDPWD